jgi:NADP-dependent 3-hydroxy acid dehydrogenase YdfG
MTTPLTGTVALITGSSSGIGAATARRLAAEGAAVALVARRRDRLDELAATIAGAGGTVLVVEADVTSEEQAAAAVERTLAELGRLDTLVSNAGIMLLGPAKFGANAFTEALRQEMIGHRVRVSVVEPGTVDTELASHLRPAIRQAAQGQIESIEPLRPEDIADAVAYIVTRDRRVAVNEMLVRASEQTW